MIESYIALWFLIVTTGFFDSKNRSLWWSLGAVNGIGLVVHTFIFANPPVYLGYFALTSFAMSAYAMRKRTLFSCMFSTAMALDALAYAIIARAWVLSLPNYAEIARDFVVLVITGHVLILVLISMQLYGPAVRFGTEAYRHFRRWTDG